MDEFNYQEKMIADLLEQFRGKKNIGAIVAAYARQLQEVYDFLVSLLNLLDLDLCIRGPGLTSSGSSWCSPAMTPVSWSSSLTKGKCWMMTCIGNSSSGKSC